MTYDEYLQEYWNRKPTMNELKKLINIITWNIWQMDGLKGTIPYSKAEEQYRQMTLFEVYGMQTEKKSENKQPLCRIYDWRGDKSLEFVSLQGKEQ